MPRICAEPQPLVSQDLGHRLPPQREYLARRLWVHALDERGQDRGRALWRESGSDFIRTADRVKLKLVHDFANCIASISFYTVFGRE